LLDGLRPFFLPRNRKVEERQASKKRGEIKVLFFTNKVSFVFLADLLAAAHPLGFFPGLILTSSHPSCLRYPLWRSACVFSSEASLLAPFQWHIGDLEYTYPVVGGFAPSLTEGDLSVAYRLSSRDEDLSIK